jgi:hypothetical protein
MIDNAVSTLANQAIDAIDATIDATSDRLHDTTGRLQDLAQTRIERKTHRLRRATLLSLVLAAIGIGAFLMYQRRAQTRDIAPDAFGDAAQREQRARDFTSVN